MSGQKPRPKPRPGSNAWKHGLVDEKGFAVYSALGIVLILFSSVALVYMMTLDERSASKLLEETARAREIYDLMEMSSTIEQVLRKSTEDTILEDSLLSFCSGQCFDDGIKIKGKKDLIVMQNNKKIFDGDYKKYLENKIKEKIFDHYHRGDPAKLSEEYTTNPTVRYDFSNFMTSKDDFKVELTPAEKDSGRLKAKIVFEDGKGVIERLDLSSGSRLRIFASAEVEANVRPFVMHREAGGFYDKLGDEDLKWILWGIQTIIGMIEANTKHKVELASD
ncbi:MAG: hypothetical protein DRO11_04495, partial [Methanobacteriota archaeon]